MLLATLKGLTYASTSQKHHYADGNKLYAGTVDHIAFLVALGHLLRGFTKQSSRAQRRLSVHSEEALQLGRSSKTDA